MQPGLLEMKVAALDGQVTVRLLGELDLATAPQLRDVLCGLYREGNHSFVFDLSELAFVDSTGLSEFVAALKHCRERGGDVVLQSPTSITSRVLTISGLDRVFTISAS